MSKLEELIQELCPNGVEYKTTESISKEMFWLMPSTPRYLEQGIPYITSKNVKNGKISFDNVAYISEDDYIEMSKNRSIQTGDLLITMIGTIGETAFVDDFTRFYGQNLYLVRLDDSIVNPKFYYYYFETQKVNLVSKKNPSSQGYIKAGSINELRIPIPPIEVQSEIVRILDNFTLLTAELTAELTARKQQYQYYLDMLFESCNGESRTLDEIGVFTRGKRFVHADAVNQDGIPCIHYGELYTYYGVVANQSKSQIRKSILEEKKLRYAKKGDVVIVGAGENDEDIGIGVAWNGDYEVAVHDACYIFETEENSKFISYYLRSSYYHKQIKAYVSKGKICAISSQGIGKAIIKVPSIDEQMRIVDMIEQFYLYLNDITQGLPAEIELRQKQYEYYRDKLLTFKELE